MIDYGDLKERMGRGLENYLNDSESMYAKNPAMKKGVEDLKRLHLDRFRKVTLKIRSTLGYEEITPDIEHNIKLFSNYLINLIISKESKFKNQLKEIAIQASLVETHSLIGDFNFKTEFNSHEIDKTGFNLTKGDDIPSLYASLSDEVVMEVHKRNIINALTQGHAMKSYHLYAKPEVKAQIDALDGELYDLYRKFTVIYDYLYFSQSDIIDWSSSRGNDIGGKVWVKRPQIETSMCSDEEANDQKLEINVSAFTFPVMCHEIIKGINEVYSMHGFHDNPEISRQVLMITDKLEYETTQLRLGSEIHERMRLLYSDDLIDEGLKLEPWFKMLFFKEPPKKFLEVMSWVIDNDEKENEKARIYFSQLTEEAKRLKYDL